MTQLSTLSAASLLLFLTALPITSASAAFVNPAFDLGVQQAAS